MNTNEVTEQKCNQMNKNEWNPSKISKLHNCQNEYNFTSCHLKNN